SNSIVDIPLMQKFELHSFPNTFIIYVLPTCLAPLIIRGIRLGLFFQATKFSIILRFMFKNIF
ncbi:MAG: hypothetical protein J0647_09050, partial [Campylobacteraceae bacterium]|nr:hypothetical protein [Campylobacteraceae bacterium]